MTIELSYSFDREKNAAKKIRRKKIVSHTIGNPLVMRLAIFWQPLVGFILLSAAIASNCMTIPSLSQNLKFKIFMIIIIIF